MFGANLFLFSWRIPGKKEEEEVWARLAPPPPTPSHALPPNSAGDGGVPLLLHNQITLDKQQPTAHSTERKKKKRLNQFKERKDIIYGRDSSTA